MNFDKKLFKAADYTVFSFMLLLPFFIGIYYAFFARKKSKTVSEYLVGNRNMSVFPVAMSLAASMITAMSLISPVAEIYYYGVQYVLIEVGKLLGPIVAVNVYIPVFHKLKLTSIYEYLGIRFDGKIRLLGTALFLLQMVLLMGMVIYIPALLFEQVMGIPFEILVPVLCGVCIFYTAFGGIFAVVWTDTFQMIVMLVGMLIFAIVGVYNIGDVKKIWEINEKGGRINLFNMDTNPLVRHSFWTLTVGGFFNVLAMGSTSQFTIQRCASLSSLKKVNIAIFAYFFIGFIIKLSTVCIGLTIYATFLDCDPLISGKVAQPDQLVAYFMMYLRDQIPVLPSMVISACFCAALSSVSTCLNSFAGVVLIDLIQPFYKKPLSDARGALILKIAVLVTGIISIGLTFSLERSTALTQTSVSLGAISAGATLGVFTLGVLLPWANSIGALVGGISGGAIVGWIALGNQMAIRSKQIVNEKLPLSIENCDNATIFNYYNTLNRTIVNATIPDPGEPFPLYKISYMYFAVIGTAATIAVGMIVSYFTGFNDPSDMDPKLFSPVIQKYLKRKRDEAERRKNDQQLHVAFI